MEVRIFSLRGWAEWAVRSVIAGGVLFWGFFLGAQVMGWEMGINIPTIQHTIKK